MKLIELLFLWILYASWTATLIILLVLFIKKFAKNHLNLKFYHALWLLILIRLLIPFTPQSPLSLFNLLPENHTPMIFDHSMETFHSLTSDALVNKQNIYNNKKNSLVPKSNLVIDSNHLSKQKIIEDKSIFIFKNPTLKSIFRTASWIWFYGFLSLCLLLIGTILIFNKKARGFKKSNDPNLIETLDFLKTKLRLNKNILLYYEETFKSPFISGWIHPKIYLSKELLRILAPKEIYYILLHELIHYKRKDLLYNFFETMALILHWFNPVVWFAIKKMRLDRELSCDHDVLEMLEENEGTAYGLTILKLSSILSNRVSKKMFPAYFYENKNQLERRILMIKEFKRNSYKMSIFFVIAFLLLSPLTLTNAQVNTAVASTNSQNNGFRLGTPSHFNTLARALDFIDYDFKVPDIELKNYVFDSISLYKDEIRVKFFVKNVVDTSGFSLTISKKDFMEDEKKNPYETYIGNHGEKFTKEVTIEPMRISNIHGMCITINSHSDWTEEAIKELEKDNTKNTKHIPTLKHTLKDFVWQEDGIWYDLNYYFENTSYYRDTSICEVSKEDLETILSSLTYTKELKNMDYVSKAWADTLYIYGDKDLKEAEKIIGFAPKFPLALPEAFIPISSGTYASLYANTEPWTQLETIFKKENDPSSNITFIQTQSTHRYNYLEKNGYDRQTKTKATPLMINSTKIFTFAEKEKQYYVWKKDNIFYTIECIGKFEDKKNIIKFLMEEAPYLN